jgi:hypothetical protein
MGEGCYHAFVLVGVSFLWVNSASTSTVRARPLIIWEQDDRRVGMKSCRIRSRAAWTHFAMPGHLVLQGNGSLWGKLVPTGDILGSGPDNGPSGGANLQVNR